MTFKKLLFVFAAVAATSVSAQTLGTVTSVNGVATVTTGTSGTAVAPGAAIVNGSRVITTSNATVTLRLNNGCTVTVPPGHGVTVLATQTCQQLTAAVQPVTTTVTTTTTTGTVPAGIGIGTPGGAVAVGAAALIGAAILAETVGKDDDDRPISGR